MKPLDVLDHNLERLLTRAWQPVVPRASFRSRLERDVLARVRPSEARPGPRLLGPVLARIVAVAAVVLALLSLVALLREGAPPGREALLARGEVVLREPAGEGPWRPLEGRAATLGALALEIATPPGATARVELPREGELTVAPASELFVAPAADHPALVTLASGGLEARVLAGTSLRLDTSEGSFLLHGGVLALAYGRDEGAREAMAGLTAGVLEVAGERFEAPAEVRLRGGRLVRRISVSAARPENPASARAAVPPQAGASRAQGEPVADVALSGSVHLASAGGEARPAPSFELFLLRQVALPRVAEPLVHAFDEAAGRFALPQVEPGVYKLFVRAPGFATWAREDLRLGAAPVQLEILLVAGATLEGVAVDAATGAPLEGVLVLSENDAPAQVLALHGLEVPELVRSVRTDAQGRFRLEHVSPGTHFVRGSGAGRSVGWARAPQVQDAEVRGGLLIALSAGGSIAGRVEDPRGRPAAGVMLVASLTDFDAGRPLLSYQGAVTDAAGEYRIDGLPAGVLTLLRFGADASSPTATPDLVFVQVRAGEAARHDFLAPRTGLELSGRVLRLDRTPVAGRILWIAPLGTEGDAGQLAWVSTTTGDEGEYAFQGLDAGTFELYVGGRPPDMTHAGSVEVAPGGPNAHDVLVHHGALRGRVVEGSSGLPAPFTVLVLWRLDGAERFAGKYFSDERGLYEIGFLEPGAYALEAHPTRPGLAMERIDWLTLGLGEVREDLDLRLPAGGGLRVEVVDSDGEPVPGAAMRVRSPGGRFVQLGRATSADLSGLYLAAGMAPGTWTLFVEAEGFEAHEETIAVQAGEPRELRVVLERAR